MQQYTVSKTQLLNKDTLLLTLRPKRSRDRMLFYPGQYAAIGFKRGGRPSPMRCFSIVSSPNQPQEVQFAARILGSFTRSLAELEPGDSVFVRGPFGNFVIDEQYDRNVILMAGGIGITPFMSMVRFATETQLPVPITLLFSYHRQEEIPFLKELRYHEQKNPNFRALFFVTKGAVKQGSGNGFFAGRIDETRLKQLTGGHFGRFTYFMCGPKDFVTSMRQTLQTNGADPHRLISEEFSPSSPANAIAATPQHTIPRWTYALTGASLVLAAGFFMALDVDQALQRNAAATPVTSSQTPATTDTSSTSTSTDTNNTTPSTSTSTSNTPSSTYSQPPVMYQQPMTSVS